MKFKYVFIWKKNIDVLFVLTKYSMKDQLSQLCYYRNKTQTCYCVLKLHFNTGPAGFGSISMEVDS